MKNTSAQQKRAPVVVVVGHIDHGKSTLLDYIRKTNVAEKEIGGITQHISAYEATHKSEGVDKKITFLDTPGHAAFSGIRDRGASVADVAILVVSAEDGVKPQTIEALNSIKNAKIPFVVAISKIDKPTANIELAKQSLAENEVYVEGYGGDVPVVPISAKNGDGISDLLDMVLLVSELSDLSGTEHAPAEGVVIESNVDSKKGLSTSLIIKNGTLKKGTCIVAGRSFAPVRMMENFLGKPIQEAKFGSPVKVIGWNTLPEVGSTFKTFDSKKEAETFLASLPQSEIKNPIPNQEQIESAPEESALTALVIEADTAGSLEAILKEIAKISVDRSKVKVIQANIGKVTENDVKTASANPNTILIAFNTKIDTPAFNLAERSGVEIHEFNIIYKLTEWIESVLKDRAPTIAVEEVVGKAKVLKVFNAQKDKQVVGGRVEEGTIPMGLIVKIERRGEVLGQGKIRELQSGKVKTGEVSAGKEFGMMIESKVIIAPGDELKAFVITQKK